MVKQIFQNSLLEPVSKNIGLRNSALENARIFYHIFLIKIHFQVRKKRSIHLWEWVSLMCANWVKKIMMWTQWHSLELWKIILNPQNKWTIKFNIKTVSSNVFYVVRRSNWWTKLLLLILDTHIQCTAVCSELICSTWTAGQSSFVLKKLVSSKYVRSRDTLFHESEVCV